MVRLDRNNEMYTKMFIKSYLLLPEPQLKVPYND